MKNEYMLLSSYHGDGKFNNRKAEVLRTVGSDHHFGIRMYINDNALGIEWFKEHNEGYAESAAENYVLGIKDYTRTGE
ncbi:hypothetical protein OAJ26_00250 [bacterium]|nr:hypothetical protein [bacterium]